MGITDEKLYQLVSELDYLPKVDLDRARALAVTDHISLYEALLKTDLLTDENLGKLVAYSLQLPFIMLSQVTIPDSVLRVTPRAVAEQYKLITYALEPGKELKIATADPGNADLFTMLAKKAGVKKYSLTFATEYDIENALRLYRKQLQAAFEELLAGKTSTTGDAGLPVAQIVDTIIEYAYFNKASDIHIEPSRTTTAVRFRIDGVLHDVVRLPKNLHMQVATRIKVLARLRTDEHLSAQDGRMRMTLADENLDIRVSVVPVMSGEKVVLRLLASHFRQFGLTDLGMQDSDLKRVRHGFERPYGMVLSTGPTGSGKTTSMYAILKILNTREKNIATIEDPVEYEVEGINQIQVNAKTNLTFASGLRSILRQDPNIIYVGEIRDEETADIAINSAMTGHLVLSTLHTNDAATALPRLNDMKIEPFLIASSINTIIAQRLVRRICDRCKMSVELTATKTGWSGEQKLAGQLNSMNPAVVAKHFAHQGTIRVYQGKGCSICNHTGYTGRVGIFEVLEVTPTIQQLIVQKSNAEAIARQAVAEGMTTILDDGLIKVGQGSTTLEEVLRATRA